MAADIWLNHTTPGSTSWTATSGGISALKGLYVDIDFTDAGFDKVPYIEASLVGRVDNWVMMLTVSEITTTSARVYIHSSYAGFDPTAAQANANYWHVTWIAYRSGGTKLTLIPWTLTWPCDAV